MSTTDTKISRLAEKNGWSKQQNKTMVTFRRGAEWSVVVYKEDMHTITYFDWYGHPRNKKELHNA